MKISIPSPTDFFGFIPGSDRKMIRWDKLCEYYDTLNSLSDKMEIIEAGKSCEGNRFIFILVSSAENLKNKEKFREISQKLSDPVKLSGQEIETLCNDGKVICMQQYGLHSNEVGGPQMVPLMLHELITSEADEIKSILDNVIFIIAPCSEPDGEIIFTDWYNKHLGTQYEGCVSPYLRHNWAGHSNNRDGIREITLEAQHINDILVRDWCPQIFQDHHHQCPWEDRMSISPFVDPYFEPMCPLLLREVAGYGAHMAMALSRAGRKGVVSGGKTFDGYNCSSYSSFALLHNTAGMLTENADVSIATPVYIQKEIQTGYIYPSVNCPDPWEGGEWHLYDIVSQMYIASVELLKYAAKNRRDILKLMSEKTLLQTRRGAEGDVKAYIIPSFQNDTSAREVLLKILENQGVKSYCSTSEFICDNAVYPEATVIVPLAQPKYAVIQNCLGAIPYPSYMERRRPDGTLWVQDSTNLCVALNMGVKAIPAHTLPDMSATIPHTCSDRVNSIMTPFGYSGENDNITLPLPSCENLSYKHANILLARGQKIYRDENGNFTNNGTPVMRKKIGLLKKSATWNEEEGFTRSLLHMYSFDYEIVMDKTVRENGVPENIDILIIPGDDSATLYTGDTRDMSKPPEFQTGLGNAGAQKLREFVSRGGRLVAWEKSCDFVNNAFSLGLKDKASCLDRTKYSTNGSSIKASCIKCDLTFGMPAEFAITHNNGPVLMPTEFSKTSRVLASIDRFSPVINGYTHGEDILHGTPCIIKSQYGSGDIILYTFNPQFRNQNDGTFKLLFNALF
ncbi:MAG: hypothetical protein IKV97_03975 [Clostridia bacterium]|nr:hypothetical protein [Clostridia bacterium]